MTILTKILHEKQKEVARLRRNTYEVSEIQESSPSFREAVLDKTTMSIIAEFKRASPSKGLIRGDLDPAKQAKIYEMNGASAISVLTDEPFFQGTMKDLARAREAVSLPILCKDFIIDSVQIDRAKASGATMILLIAAALSELELQQLYTYAKERNLEVLCEVNDENEMERVLKLGARIIGINNRDLKSFHVSLETTARLARMVSDPEIVLVSESGIQTKADVEAVAQAGARAILVGESFMRAEDVDKTMEAFQVPLPNTPR